MEEPDAIDESKRFKEQERKDNFNRRLHAEGLLTFEQYTKRMRGGE